MKKMSVEIQIVSEPNLEKIENFFNDQRYRETIEYSASFNTRLCLERRLRKNLLDPQTGVAQNHCSLFKNRKQRMPGFREGQIYTYPAARWRKTRRQYLIKRPFNLVRRGDNEDSDFNGTILEESSSLGGADTSDSKDSQNIKEELPKEWFYDDMDMTNIDDLEEPKSPDDEYDYDPRYGNKKRKKRRPGRKPITTTPHISDMGPRKGRPPGGISISTGAGGGIVSSGVGRGRGRRKGLMAGRNLASDLMPNSPHAEPPSFESVAKSVENASNDNNDTNNSELRNYRKYL